MDNILSDQIEKIILDMLNDRQNEEIILKRRELANELDCAPSQITYVINTRFSSNQNFIVESRRGSGGYIKISSVKKYPIMIRKSNKNEIKNYSDPKKILNKFLVDLQNNNIFNELEFELFMTSIQTFFEFCPPNELNKGIETLLFKMKNLLRRYE